jgi:hypothetical protein
VMSRVRNNIEVFCLCLINRIKKTTPDTENTEEGEGEIFTN